MAKIPESVLCELLVPRAKASGKADIVSTFKIIFATSTQAAKDSNLPPGLGLQVFDNVSGQDEEAGLLLLWNSMEHHDGLSETPGFAPAAKLFGEKIVPNLETPLEPIYFWTRYGEVALRSDAGTCEVFEVQYIGEEDVDKLCKKLSTALDEPSDVKSKLEGDVHDESVSSEYLGYFFGPKYNDPHKFVIALKWKSRPRVTEVQTARYIELAISQALGQSSKVLKQLKMVAE